VVTDTRDDLGEGLAQELGERAPHVRLDVTREADYYSPEPFAIKRLADPQDITNLLLFLASDDAAGRVQWHPPSPGPATRTSPGPRACPGPFTWP
jgi:NAD(P)-dependent dehydrogenase (short-subunit alcohol dehydrogenase family)